MTLLRVAARRATPMMARVGRQQTRLASGSTPHFDPFAVDPNNKKQKFLYYAAMTGALAAPIFAVRYQLSQYKYDKRSFSGYTLTFLLLASEMATFIAIVVPLPHAVRKRVFTFLSESPVVGKVAYGLKIAFIFVGILFADAFQRMVRITAEVEAAKASGSGPSHDVRAETNFAARKFYAQRNAYLTGFTLFLSIVLTRTFYIMLDLIHAQEEYAKLKKISEARGSGKSGEDVEELKKKLSAAEARARDFDTLKKQSEAQAREYDRLADDYNKATGSISDKRKD
ncbi:YET3 [Sanghuangporus vaninii]